MKKMKSRSVIKITNPNFGRQHGVVSHMSGEIEEGENNKTDHLVQGKGCVLVQSAMEPAAIATFDHG